MSVQDHGPFIYVHFIGTVPAMQRQGYGSQVMTAVICLLMHFRLHFRLHLRQEPLARHPEIMDLAYC